MFVKQNNEYDSRHRVSIVTTLQIRKMDDIGTVQFLQMTMPIQRDFQPDRRLIGDSE